MILWVWSSGPACRSTKNVGQAEILSPMVNKNPTHKSPWHVLAGPLTHTQKKNLYLYILITFLLDFCMNDHNSYMIEKN